MLDDFVRFAHRGDVSALQAIFPTDKAPSSRENVLHAIGLFAKLHMKDIADEVLRFREPGVPNWILDLTTTSLFHLLAYWGERYRELDVTCDESKPLKGDQSVFDSMVGRTEKIRISFGDEEHPYSFNLTRPIRLVNSKESEGVQVADVVAAVTAKLSSNNYGGVDDPHMARFPDLISPHLHRSIWPDLSDVDLRTPKCFMNTMILHHLLDQSLAGENLYEGLPELARYAYKMHPQFIAENPDL